LQAFRHHRFIVSIVAAVFAALVFVGAALAWEQTYISDANVCYICLAASASNSGLAWNEEDWDTNYSLEAQLSLCHTDGSCYAGASQSGGYGTDSRTIAYGYAVCGPLNANHTQVWFYNCWTTNN